MDQTRWEDQLAGVVGIGFVVLALASTFVTGSPPAQDAAPAEIRDYMVDKRGGLQASAILTGISAPLVLFFFAHLRQKLARAGDESALPVTGVVSFAVTIAMVFAGTAVSASMVVTDGFAAGAGDDLIQFAWNVGTMAFAVGGCAIALGLGAFAASILRTRALPSWLGWMAAVIAILNLLGVLGVTSLTLSLFGFVGFITMALWIVIISVMLLRGRTAASLAA